MAVDGAVVAGDRAGGVVVEVGEITVGLDARAVEGVTQAIEWKERRQHRGRTIVGIRGDVAGLLGYRDRIQRWMPGIEAEGRSGREV